MQALRGLHHPELRFVDDMKRVLELLAKKETALARETYRKLRSDCLVIDGRKTGDKVRGLFFAAEHVCGAFPVAVGLILYSTMSCYLRR